MKLSPHIRFNNDKCREAFAFYKDCFGKAETTFMTLGDSPMAKEMPEAKDKIMHATFKSGDVFFTGSDTMRDPAIIGDQVSLMVSCDDEKQLRDLFAKLEQGGDVFMQPEKQFWGAVFGMVTDKYGVEWNLNYQFEK